MAQHSTMKILLISLLTLLGSTGVAHADDSLYRDMGGKEGITRVIDEFLAAVIDDERIVHHFKDANVTRLREKLIEQVCEVAGGPCEYTGDNMVEAHRGMNLNDADFNALVEDMQIGLRNAGMPLSVENRVIAALAPMHGDIVHR